MFFHDICLTLQYRRLFLFIKIITMNRFSRLYTLALMFAGGVWASAQAPSGHADSPMVHDPVIACESGKYYLFSTGQRLFSLVSDDLHEWKSPSSVFKEVPQWAMDSVPGYKGHTWAPDIIFHNGRYHLFYSCSTFGKNTSAIGHASRSTLSTSSDEPWVDTGAVITSHPGDDYNAIDPNVVIDYDGKPWMTFGSFWRGIKMVRLKDDLSSVFDGENPVTLCTRLYTPADGKPMPKENSVEAPFIMKHGGYYYLFVSYDYCCRGLKSTYKVVVGRSREILGPYVDRDGRSMLKGGGSLLISDTPEHVAVGHCAVYDFDGRTIFFAHGYSKAHNGESRLVVRYIKWSDDGWPEIDS